MIRTALASFMIALLVATTPVSAMAMTKTEIAAMRENLAFMVIVLSQTGLFSVDLLNKIIRIYNERMIEATNSATLPTEPITAEEEDPAFSGIVEVADVIEAPIAPIPELMPDPKETRIAEINERIIFLNSEKERLYAEADAKGEAHAIANNGGTKFIKETQKRFRIEMTADIETELKALRAERAELLK